MCAEPGDEPDIYLTRSTQLNAGFSTLPVRDVVTPSNGAFIRRIILFVLLMKSGHYIAFFAVGDGY